MRPIVVFFMMLCFGTSFGQMQKLGELSSGKFLDSAIIMEEDESDVFGYCLLYELDRKSKEVFELEYVILDKNLNKLTSISLTQAVFKIWLAKTSAQITFVKKIDNQLTIAVNDRLVNATSEEVMPFFNYRFINLNLDDFSFSKEYKYENFTKKELEYKAGDKVEIDDFWNLQKLYKTKTEYLLSFACPEYNPKVAVASNMNNYFYKKHKSVKRFAILDKDLKTVWSKDINPDKKTACRYEYLDSDEDILLLQKITQKKKGGLQTKSVEAYNIKTGEFLGELKIEDKEYSINLYSSNITKDKIHLFTNAYNKKGKSMGYGHLVFDKQSAQETNRNFMLWKNLKSVIPGIDDFGSSKKEGWMLAQDFIITPKGNTLMVTEMCEIKAPYTLGNNPKVYANLKDMYLIEFNPEGSVAFSKKIEKKNTVQIPSGISALDMKIYGFFDYMFCQKINKTGDFVMYYTLNDQEGNRKKLIKKPLWTLGIISFVDGEYGFEELPLYGNDIKIYPSLAKNGYIRLTEINEKTNQAEMRLEKVNY